jgi:DNA-directed RNA polymerase specialized sigma24 family protein
MCVLTSPTVVTPLTNDEIAAWHKFATRVARNLARHPYIDYEQCAIDGLMAALKLRPNGGMAFKGLVALKTWTEVRDAEREAARHKAVCESVDWEELDEIAAPDGRLDALDSLSPADLELAVDVFIEKLGEQVAAAKRGVTRHQIRNRLSSIRRFLERQMGDDR